MPGLNPQGRRARGGPGAGGPCYGLLAGLHALAREMGIVEAVGETSRAQRLALYLIIVAVATDTEGLPLHVAVLRGNRNDTQTLQGLLHTLRRRFAIQEATFVFDGGMSSQLNLEAMSAASLGFVTRLSTSTLRALVEELGLARLSHETRVFSFFRVQVIE